jgi:hypothetical protein
VQAVELLQYTPWTLQLLERSQQNYADLLTAYFGHNWLNDVHLDQMKTVLQHELSERSIDDGLLDFCDSFSPLQINMQVLTTSRNSRLLVSD